jgi:DNA-binding transcriptional LysR family regulator
MDRFESMSVFAVVVEAQGFSAASRRLGMPLATVSRKVSELEETLGVQLLNRSTRKVTLTDTGRQYFEACRRILDDLGEAERAASGEYSAPRGELILTTPIVFGRLHLVPIVAEFLEAYREVDVQMMLVDRVVDLLDEHVDLALRIGELPDSSMIAVRIGSIGRVVCASPAYLAAHGVPAHPSEVAAHNAVTFAGLSSAKEWSFRVGTSVEMFPVRSRFTVTTAEAALDAAIAGAGITRVLSYQAAAAVMDGRLAIVLREFEVDPSPASLVYPSGRLVPLKLRAFLDFAAPRLKARLQSIAAVERHGGSDARSMSSPGSSRRPR